jgi:hypothetical protein
VLESHVVYSYGEDKRPTERVTYRKDGSLANRTVFRRQGNQTQSESISYDPKGNVIGGTNTTNDLKSKQAESLLYNANKTVRIQASMADNPDGSREFKEEHSDGTFKREVFKPGGKDSNMRIYYNSDGTIRSRERYIYETDSFSNVIKSTRFVAKGDSEKFEPTDVNYHQFTYYEKN